jgi:sialic acid synthase SpsE
LDIGGKILKNMKMNKTVLLDNGFELRNFGKPFIIAEIGSNHNGDMDLARKIIDEAKSCGCDAVKFQSFDDKSLICKAEYQANTKYNDSPKKHFGSLEEMVKKYYLREEQHYELKAYCEKIGIVFSSSPFSNSEVDLLINLDVPYLKVASMDINNYPLLRYMALTGKPIVLSTGMATLAEIDNAVHIIEQNGNSKIILLHCISVYPPAFEDINLRNITMLQQTFPYPVGFSDHSLGIHIPLAAIALGSCIIEKHFTIEKDLPGWDHEISADPEEMRQIVDFSKQINISLGSFPRTVSEAEEKKKLKFRRSIVSTVDMKAGHVICQNDLTSKRPGTGIAPDLSDYLTGRRLKKDVSFDSMLKWEDFE